VLIAFIVVAAVFSYVMLGAGFFATQEAQRTVHTGSQQASSSLEIIGNVYGKTTATTEASTASANLQCIEFTIGNTAGGTPIDITQMLVTFVCGEKAEVLSFDKGNTIEKIGDGEAGKSGDELTIDKSKWGVVMTYNDVGKDATGTATNRNKLLEPGEQFVLRVMFPNDANLKPNTRFSVNLQPAIGAAYPIKKTVPSTLYEVNIL
jgi:flagellin FlaB